ncbi:hypothetical protein [Terricaulis sp.]
MTLNQRTLFSQLTLLLAQLPFLSVQPLLLLVDQREHTGKFG